MDAETMLWYENRQMILTMHCLSATAESEP